MVALVGGALLASGLIEIYFSYQENQRALVKVEREKAFAAAETIERLERRSAEAIVRETFGAMACGAGRRQMPRWSFVHFSYSNWAFGPPSSSIRLGHLRSETVRQNRR